MSQTPVTTKTCACYVVDHEIVYCALHVAAPELLEAAKAILKKESDMKTGHAYQEYRALEAAITHATIPTTERGQ